MGKKNAHHAAIQSYLGAPIEGAPDDEHSYSGVYYIQPDAIFYKKLKKRALSAVLYGRHCLVCQKIQFLKIRIGSGCLAVTRSGARACAREPEAAGLCSDRGDHQYIGLYMASLDGDAWHMRICTECYQMQRYSKAYGSRKCAGYQPVPGRCAGHEANTRGPRAARGAPAASSDGAPSERRE